MKYLFLLLAALVAVVVVAAPPTHTATDAYYQWAYDTSLKAASFDTLAASDSTTLCTKRKLKLEDGWEYVLRINSWTGTGNDSVRVLVNLDVFTWSTDASASYRFRFDGASDTLKGLWNNDCVIDAATIQGTSATIKLFTTAAGGSQLIPGKVTLYKRRPIAMTIGYK